MSKLDLQAKQFMLVVGADYVKDFQGGVETLVASFGGRYAAAYHDRDSNYRHYHLVLVYDKRVRISTMLNRCAVAFNCDKCNIQIQPVRSLNASIQYLVHKNDIDKEQYPDFIIVSNFDKAYLMTLLNTTDYEIELNFDILCDIVANCNTLSEIMSNIGLSNYNKYRNVIRDLVSEIWFK